MDEVDYENASFYRKYFLLNRSMIFTRVIITLLVLAGIVSVIYSLPRGANGVPSVSTRDFFSSSDDFLTSAINWCEKHARLAALHVSDNVSLNLNITWGHLLAGFAILSALMTVISGGYWFKHAVGMRRTPGFKEISARPQKLADESISQLEGSNKILAQSKEYESADLFTNDKMRSLIRSRAPSPSISRSSTKPRFFRDHPKSTESRLYSATVQLFGGMNESDFEALFSAVEWLHLDSGNVLYRKGDSCQPGIYVIVSGTLEASLDEESDPVKFGEGQSCGDISLFTNQPRMLTVRASANTDVVRLDRAALLDLVTANPRLLSGFVRNSIVRNWRISRFSLYDFFDLPEEENSVEQKLFKFFAAEPRKRFFELPENVPSLFSVKPGRLLFGKGDPSNQQLYILAEGRACYIPSEDQKDSVELEAGAVVGAIELFTGKGTHYRASVRCLTQCKFISISLKQFESTSSSDLIELTFVICEYLCSHIAYYARMGFQTVWVPAGRPVLEQGSPVDSLYILNSGRLQITRGDRLNPSKAEERLIDITRGEIVGEMSLLAGDRTHLHTCTAIRDSELVRIPKRSFEVIQQKYPHVLRKIGQIMADRLRNISTITQLKPLPIVTVAIVSSTREVGAYFVDKLSDALDEHGSTLKVTGDDIHELLAGEEDLPEMFDDLTYRSRVTRLLAELESDNRFLLFVCDQEATEWTKCCIRQADLVLIALPANESPGLTPVEAELLWNSRSKLTLSNKDLVLLHPDSTRTPKNTRLFFHQRKLARFHHIKYSSKSHFARLARNITGKTIALVLGGGGARGLAHLGAFRALAEEDDMTIDYICGTSQGAFMAALYASRLSLEEVEEATLNQAKLFNLIELLRDATLPVMSYFSGYRFSRGIKRFFPDDMRIEDLWIPYFCVTTNVSKGDISVHRFGSLSLAVRASMTLLEYLPPVCWENDLLIDGGYTDNLPCMIARECFSPELVIAIDVETKETAFDNLLNYGDHLSGFYLAWLTFRSIIFPFTKKRIPRYAEIVSSLSYINHARNMRMLERERAVDIYIVPELGNTKLLDYDRSDEIIEIGYKYSKVRITEYKLQNRGRNPTLRQSSSQPSMARKRASSVPLPRHDSTNVSTDKQISDAIGR